MREIFNKIYISATTKIELFCAEILKKQINKRTDIPCEITDKADADIGFKTDMSMQKDCYKIENNNSIIFTSRDTRGFIFAIGYFLRKTEYTLSSVTLCENIDGFYSPDKTIRGHQLGYRTTANCYESWTYKQYEDYMTELMFFGCNTMEHTHIENKPENYNRLMQYDTDEFLNEASKIADKLDMDVSVWYPNDESTDKEYYSSREKIIKNMSRINAIFPPGGDPGCFSADEFISRADKFGKILKEVHPNAQMWPSAQTPETENWGNIFIEEMKKFPKNIDGIITGPNRAFNLDELRRKLPLKYPIRLYPDITHNVRCEYPVHFNRDDWHYTFSSTLSREAINPRPTEYALLHKLTSPYIVGSVSYSEGINDDVNKCVWSNLDFFPQTTAKSTLEDYARLFFFNAENKEAIASGILMLEKNWEGAPQNNPGIEFTYEIFKNQLNAVPQLIENWRFVTLLFRAECDLFVRKKYIFENNLIKKANLYLLNAEIENAKQILSLPFTEDIIKLREDINLHGEILNKLIGLQLDVENYCANGWERGATLDTIDNPITDRQYFLNRIAYCENMDKATQKDFLFGLINRNTVCRDEFYYSVALDELVGLGTTQTPDFYMAFQGDNPSVNNGSMPMSMTKIFDHYTFNLKTGGLTHKGDYKLILNIKPRYRDNVDNFEIKINGNTLYKGKQYGGIVNKEWDEKYSAPEFESHEYIIPYGFIENGCIDLEIKESIVGIMISEVKIIKT